MSDFFSSNGSSSDANNAQETDEQQDGQEGRDAHEPHLLHDEVHAGRLLRPRQRVEREHLGVNVELDGLAEGTHSLAGVGGHGDGVHHVGGQVKEDEGVGVGLEGEVGNFRGVGLDENLEALELAVEGARGRGVPLDDGRRVIHHLDLDVVRGH